MLLGAASPRRSRRGARALIASRDDLKPHASTASQQGEAVTGSSPLSLIASLRGALEAARGVRSRNDLVFALDRIAAVIEGLGYRSVTINLHRPAWDDRGLDGPRTAGVAPTPLGKTSSWEQGPAPGRAVRALVPTTCPTTTCCWP